MKISPQKANEIPPQTPKGAMSIIGAYAYLKQQLKIPKSLLIKVIRGVNSLIAPLGVWGEH